MKKLNVILAATLLTFSGLINAQYNTNAGENRVKKVESAYVPIMTEDAEMQLDMNGDVMMEEVFIEVDVASDDYGNAAGTQYDLATDGAFEGNTVAVLHLYTGEGFNFDKPKAALEQKGFSVFRWIDHLPSAEELREKLKGACQLWVISSNVRELNDEHAEVIKEFFDSGKGLYIWGDNEPYYADANFLTQKIFGTNMTGNVPGDTTVGISGESENRSGIVNGHLISTGVANMYEGVTIATINATQELSPLIYGSADNLVAAVYEKDGKRAILDGGFTRLYYKWDTAGTGRYVKNAAAWLVNYERFGELVYEDTSEEEIDMNEEGESEKDVIKIKEEYKMIEPELDSFIMDED